MTARLRDALRHLLRRLLAPALDAVRDQLAAVDDRLAAVAARLDGLEATNRAVLDTQHAAAESVGRVLAAQRGALERLEAEQRRLADQVAALRREPAPSPAALVGPEPTGDA